MINDSIVLWAGEFGRAVSDALPKNFGSTRIQLTEEMLSKPVDFIGAEVKYAVFVASRPLRISLLRIDEFLWNSGVNWTACEMNDTRLILGPNIFPNVSPCFRCCSSRYRALSFDKQQLAEETAFERHMAINSNIEIEGFTPSIVHLAVEHIKLTRAEGISRAGLLREVMLPDLSIKQGRAVSLHGCQLCRVSYCEPTDRFIVDLKSTIGIFE